LTTDSADGVAAAAPRDHRSAVDRATKQGNGTCGRTESPGAGLPAYFQAATALARAKGHITGCGLAVPAMKLTGAHTLMSSHGAHPERLHTQAAGTILAVRAGARRCHALGGRLLVETVGATGRRSGEGITGDRRR